METGDVLKIAIDGNFKSVSNYAREMGQSWGERYLYAQTEKPVDVKRTNIYQRFLDLLFSINEANGHGADFILAHTQTELLRRRKKPKKTFNELLAEATAKDSDVITASLTVTKKEEIEKEILEAIASKQRLLISL